MFSCLVIRRKEMEQYNKTNIPYIGGYKPSPASPASLAPSARQPALQAQDGAFRTPRSIEGSQGTPRRPVNGQRFRPSHRPDRPHPGQAIRPPDPITHRRVSRLLAAVRPLLGEEITTTWLARTLVRFDAGPMVDPPRLGPALRTLGFRPMRRRRGSHRRSTWLVPGSPAPCLGRPRRWVSGFRQAPGAARTLLT
jgi:hypothetical protein